MKKLIRYSREFLELVKEFFAHGQVYFSLKDRAQVFLLKLAATGPGRQVFSRALIFLRLRPWPDGLYLRRAGSDILVMQEIFEDRIYRPVEQWSLRPKPTILDLGGNIGLATMYFVSIFPEAEVVVVEPEQANRKLLEQNCAGMVAGKRLKVAGNFVGARDGFAGIDRGADSWAFRKVDSGTVAAEQIECLSMPSLMQRFGLAQVDLLKCDIEGSEAEVFADCAGWIHRVRFLIVETHGSYRLTDLYGHLKKAGWDFKNHHQLQTEREGLCFLEQAERSLTPAHA